jgi:hypothetical protein
MDIIEFARQGGIARAKKLTKAQRLASSRKAIRAWKAKAKARRLALTAVCISGISVEASGKRGRLTRRTMAKA